MSLPRRCSADHGSQVTWHYYLGMLAFLNGEDKKANEELTWTLNHCPAESIRNQECVVLEAAPKSSLLAQTDSDLLNTPSPTARIIPLAGVTGPLSAARRAVLPLHRGDQSGQRPGIRRAAGVGSAEISRHERLPHGRAGEGVLSPWAVQEGVSLRQSTASVVLR